MIYSFTVKNFLSIAEEQTVSFASTSDKTMRDVLTVEVKPNCFINKLGIFYGANASGKSNMLYAMEAVFDLLYQPRTDKAQRLGYAPFALKKGEPTYFKIIFFKGSIQYDYEVSYCGTHIISEDLYYYPQKSKALFYHRVFTGDDTQPLIEFGSTLKLYAKTKQALRDNTLNNHSVLSTFGKLSLKEDAVLFADLYNWVHRYVHEVNGDKEKRYMVSEMNAICNDENKKTFYLELLRKADFNIRDFNIIDDKDSLPQKLLEFVSSAKMPEDQKFSLMHDVVFANHSINGDFNVDSSAQSIGTLRFIERLDYLYDMIKENHIYLLDEIGSNLHPDLTVYYLNLFLMNSQPQSQLLFATHNILLLDEDFVRRDMVYLTDKDTQTAESRYTRVCDMGLHKNLSLFKAYKIGKLGAVPEIGSFYLNTESNC